MKKLITLILVLSAWNSFAQLTFIKSSDKLLTPFQLTNLSSIKKEIVGLMLNVQLL